MGRFEDSAMDLLTPKSQAPVGMLEREIALLDGFDTASVALIKARELQRRVDTKFLLPRSALPGMLESLASDFQLVRSCGAPAGTYETTYFDTPDWDLYHAHRRGRRPRQKVRLRAYVERDMRMIEVKTKTRYGLTDKARRFRETGESVLSADEHSWLATVLNVPSHTLRPVLSVDFPRVTLVGVGVEERVTFDLGLDYRGENGAVSFPDVVVGEIKQPRFGPRTPGMSAFREAGIRPSSMSKCCVGVALTGGLRETHSFRPTIHALERVAHA